MNKVQHKGKYDTNCEMDAKVVDQKTTELSYKYKQNS